jgi:ubiquinone/menaquinone biosynthesis C-methylase UbiE
VYACDASPNAVAFACKTAAAAGVADQVSALVCAGEQLPLASETVDIVHGEALLYHLLLPQAGAEIARVMKNGAGAALKTPLDTISCWSLHATTYLMPGRRPTKGPTGPLSSMISNLSADIFLGTHIRGLGCFP